MKRPMVVLFLALAGLCPLVAAAPASRHTWPISASSWVKRVAAEKGADRNGHPAKADAAALGQALAAVRWVDGEAEEALFTPKETEELGNAMAEAFALAGPGEDLVLLSTRKREEGLFGRSLGVTARAFVRDGSLQLIVREARLPFYPGQYVDSQLAMVTYGSRAKASGVVLRAPGGNLRRTDWVALPLAGTPAPVAPPTPATAVPPPAKPAATPVPSKASAPPPGLEERLRTLKRLREQDLISESDYQDKKRELLKGL